MVPSGFCADVKYKLGPKDFTNILHENGWARENGGIGKLGPDDTRTGFRFTPEHLKSTGNKAQNVRKAVQTFSHTNAKTLLVLGRKNVYSARHAQALHDSVKLFNDWYDIFSLCICLGRSTDNFMLTSQNYNLKTFFNVSRQDRKMKLLVVLPRH